MVDGSSHASGLLNASLTYFGAARPSYDFACGGTALSPAWSMRVENILGLEGA